VSLLQLMLLLLAYLCSDTNHAYVQVSTSSTLLKPPIQLTACRSSASITSLLGVLVATPTKVVSPGVDDDGTLSDMSVDNF
jgi:hypothetical protein